MMSPSSFAVRALKALQKSMMLTPACPSAGPTGGAGVALAAGICSLICPTTFFISFPSADQPRRHGGTETSCLAPRAHPSTLRVLRDSVAMPLLQLLDLQEVQ